MSLQRTGPRIAKKEMIITRTKSAQQRRQLQEINKGMTKDIEVLKTPTNKMYKNARKKRKSSEKKKEEILNITEDEEITKEYYPDKLKRKFEKKRTFLKPKYESHTVVKLNKRKLGTPQREISSEDMNSTSQFEDWSSKSSTRSDVFTELGMEELIRIVEETESLEDDDLMEILTCPSPVWWEDPPDESYLEDDLYTKTPEKQQKTPPTSTTQKSKELRTETNSTEGKKNNEKPGINDLVNKSKESYLKKRSKLENLLGNIKNKVINIEDKNNVSENRNDNNEERTNLNLNKNNDKDGKNIEDNNDVTQKAVTNFDDNKDKTQNSESTVSCRDLTLTNEEVCDNRKPKRNSESTESLPDLGFTDEDMLRDLENMDIPIEENEKDPSIITEQDKELENQKQTAEVPLNLPRLTKRPNINLNSPTAKSVSDDTESTVSGQENVDTISDTNIKFIIDDDIEPFANNSIDKSKNEMDVDSKSNATLDVLKALSDKKEYITVYKIVSSEPEEAVNKFKNIPEYSSFVENLMKEDSGEDLKCNGQLNSFFKKCKFANRKRKKDDAKDLDARESFCDTCEPCTTTYLNQQPKKSITVAQDENVKYCLFCSAIFDTDDCSYCLKSKKGVTYEIGNQT